MSGHEQHPDKLFVPLDDELKDLLEPPFGVLEFMLGDTIYESPFYHARYMGDDGEPQDMLLHYFNTTVRLFRGKPWATHLDVRFEDRKVGVTVEEELADAMLELHYPYLEQPFIDSASLNWLAERALGETVDLDEELRDL